jgi:rRNA maturation endonuclease Nob1
VDASTAATDHRQARRLGYRLTCAPCQVAWTGDKSDPCWVCGSPGTTGVEPNRYPANAG